ncbi:MAG: hypothetical protein D6715_04740 [Calditrichaeota bacterium]|nr:MAG: hypothetical protein D6715_04740 [Calditrichota bacterium]
MGRNNSPARFDVGEKEGMRRASFSGPLPASPVGKLQSWFFLRIQNNFFCKIFSTGRPEASNFSKC